jgi:hypothetical protein
LPDGLFSYQFGYILEDFGMENVGLFYDHLEYLMAIWYNFWPFGIFFPFWYVWIKKNLATLFQESLLKKKINL